MKKTFRIVLATAIMAMVLFMFTGCYEGFIDTDLVISSREGAGTRTMTVRIYHPDAGPLEGIDGNNQDIGTYLPGGAKSVEAVLKETCKLKDATITLKENTDKDYDTVTLSFAFDSIADYNAKMKSLCSENDPFVDATLSVDGDTVTWKEMTGNFEAAMMWAVVAVRDSDKFNATGDTTVETMSEVDKCVVTIGDKENVIALTKANGKLTSEEYTATGTIKASAPTTDPGSDNKPTEPAKPVTGSGMPVAALALTAVSGAAVAVLAFRKSRKNG